MILQYEAVDRSGRSVTDTIDAADMKSAAESLRARDLFVTQLAPSTSGATKGRSGKSAVAIQPVSKGNAANAKLSIRELATFTRQMAMLLSSGSSLVPAIQSIARQFTKASAVQMMRQITLDLEEGEPLASALRKYPRTFDCTYCAIVAAGEASATMPEMFARLASIVGKRRLMRSKVLGAMAYPALLSSLSTVIVGVLLFFVMPRFGDMFKTLGVDLPTSTALMLGVGQSVKTNWLVALICPIGTVAGIVFLMRSRVGQQWMSDVSIHVPILGRLVSGLIQGETFRVLGMLIEARVGVLETIELVQGVTRNRKYQELYARMESEVSSGGSISRAMESSGLVGAGLIQAIRTGEDSGQLGTAATFVADVLDEDNTELLGT
ncbi:MAG: type II secretion system F family protein, partial [Phycisphaerales bacterium]|nr:type II secretion system F family protein [Phycisphaerales bacterium]